MVVAAVRLDSRTGTRGTFSPVFFGALILPADSCRASKRWMACTPPILDKGKPVARPGRKAKGPTANTEGTPGCRMDGVARSRWPRAARARIGWKRGRGIRYVLDPPGAMQASAGPQAGAAPQGFHRFCSGWSCFQAEESLGRTTS